MEVQITRSSTLAGKGVTSGTKVGGNECSRNFSYVPCNRTSTVKSFLYCFFEKFMLWIVKNAGFVMTS